MISQTIFTLAAVAAAWAIPAPPEGAWYKIAVDGKSVSVFAWELADLQRAVHALSVQS